MLSSSSSPTPSSDDKSIFGEVLKVLVENYNRKIGNKTPAALTVTTAPRTSTTTSRYMLVMTFTVEPDIVTSRPRPVVYGLLLFLLAKTVWNMKHWSNGGFVVKLVARLTSQQAVRLVAKLDRFAAERFHDANWIISYTGDRNKKISNA